MCAADAMGGLQERVECSVGNMGYINRVKKPIKSVVIFNYSCVASATIVRVFCRSLLITYYGDVAVTLLLSNIWDVVFGILSNIPVVTREHDYPAMPRGRSVG